MRIIAGEFRGRRLLPPLSDVTRPITDRAKQSLFDILAGRIDGARVYDCFSGTGSLGLECLSRGAAHVTFLELDRSAVQWLRRNIDSLGVAARARVVAQDLFKWFKSPAAREQAERADLVLLDPPYRLLRECPTDLKELATTLVRGHLARDATVVFRHDSRDLLELAPLVRYDEREYGGMKIEFLRHSA